MEEDGEIEVRPRFELKTFAFKAEALFLIGFKNRKNQNESKGVSVQTAEYGKCTPEIFFLKLHCTPEKGRGTIEFGCGSIV